MTTSDPDTRLYFRQLLAGYDFATENQFAQQMRNFVYVIGDRQTGEAVLVDPAWGVSDLVDLVEADGLRVTGALATHFHQDHIGGDFSGMPIEGIKELLSLRQVPIHIQADEQEWVHRVTEVGAGDLVTHRSGDTLQVGEIGIELIHTPGHTPGSQCFWVDDRFLVSGDTLFLEGCGRMDLPGSDPAAMYDSLTKKLAKVPDDAVLFPGHLYSAEPAATMGDTRRWNYVFKPATEEQWLAAFGG